MFKRVLIFLGFLLFIMSSKVFASDQLIQHYLPAHFQKGKVLNIKLNSQPVFNLSLDSLNSLGYPSYGEYTSPVLNTNFPFKEIIFSWNSNTPEGTGLVFYLRTRNQQSDWSDWFCLAQWGSIELPVAELEKENSYGKLDIDILKLTENADEIQYRIGFFSQDKIQTPLVKMITICYGQKDALQRQTDNNIESAINLTKTIPVPYISQKTGQGLSSRICGPTSLAMILNYYGIKKSALETAIGCHDKKNDAYGNWPFIVAYGSEFGLYGWVAKFDSLNEIRTEISKGFPVIAGLSYNTGELPGSPIPGGSTPGHLLVVCGFDENGDVETCDPAGYDEITGRITYSKDEFEKVWLSSGGVALLFRRDIK